MMLMLFVLVSVPLAAADLQVGFYNSSCPKAETIVRNVVQRHFLIDQSITAALLRMHFHDCFVRGCDASILINPTPTQDSEKNAGPNLSVRGFGVIDKAKARLELQCPSTVSCADIIALATRDAVVLAGGLHYAVPTGRQDGLVSNPNDGELPGPTFTIEEASQMFASKGLTLDNMVVLLGAHTVGVAHCNFFRDRLFNFQGTGKPDPTMDEGLKAKLIGICGRSSLPLRSDPTAFLDQGTSFAFDNQYYQQIVGINKGVMLIDQELALDNSTAGTVAGLKDDNAGFLNKFGEAMAKLGSIEVLEGSQGEIRKICGSFN